MDWVFAKSKRSLSSKTSKSSIHEIGGMSDSEIQSGIEHEGERKVATFDFIIFEYSCSNRIASTFRLVRHCKVASPSNLLNSGAGLTDKQDSKQFLKKYWKNHIVYEEFPVFGSRLKVDIVNATLRIAVEVHGKQHSAYNKFFHGDSRLNYLKSIKRDVAKEKWLVLNEFQLVEVYENEVKDLSEQFFKDKFNINL